MLAQQKGPEETKSPLFQVPDLTTFAHLEPDLNYLGDCNLMHQFSECLAILRKDPID